MCKERKNKPLETPLPQEATSTPPEPPIPIYLAMLKQKKDGFLYATEQQARIKLKSGGVIVEATVKKKCPEDCSQCFNYEDVVPNPQISSNWGNKNKNRFENMPRGGYTHKGVDIHTGDNKVAVHSLLCGEVVHIRNSFKTNEYREGSLGNLVVIKSTDKSGKIIYIMYCHLDSVIVKSGEKVKHGQQIAVSGSTGNASDGSLPNGVLGKGIKKEFFHIHIEASRKYTMGNNTFIDVAKDRVDPELFMKTKFDKDGNTITVNAIKIK